MIAAVTCNAELASNAFFFWFSCLLFECVAGVPFVPFDLTPGNFSVFRHQEGENTICIFMIFKKIPLLVFPCGGTNK